MTYGDFVFRVRHTTAPQPAASAAPGPAAPPAPPSEVAAATTTLTATQPQQTNILPTQPLLTELSPTQPVGALPVATQLRAPQTDSTQAPAHSAQLAASTDARTPIAPAPKPDVEMADTPAELPPATTPHGGQLPTQQLEHVEQCPGIESTCAAAGSPAPVPAADDCGAHPGAASPAGSTDPPPGACGPAPQPSSSAAGHGMVQQPTPGGVAREANSGSAPMDGAEPGGSSGPAAQAVAEHSPPVAARPNTEPEQMAVEGEAEEEIDIEARVNGLLPFLPKGCPTAVSVMWLVQEALHLAAPPGDAEAAAVAEEVAQAFRQGLEERASAARQLLLHGGAEGIAEFDRLPAILRGMCREDRIAADLRLQLAALAEEERAWLALQAKYCGSGATGDVGAAAAVAGCSGTDNAASQAANKVMEEGAAADLPATAGAMAAAGMDVDSEAAVVAAVNSPAEQALDVALADLRAVQQRADFELEMQVAALENFVTKAELRLARAEQTCSVLHAACHDVMFDDAEALEHPDQLFRRMLQNPAQIDHVPPTQPSQQAA